MKRLQNDTANVLLVEINQLKDRLACGDDSMALSAEQRRLESLNLELARRFPNDDDKVNQESFD